MLCHRDSEHLRPAITSMLAQTFRDFEFVLVDNGCGLGADALGEPGRDPRLRRVNLPRNEGISAGTNAGVAAARTGLIAIMDYDDLAVPDRLEKQLAVMKREPRLGVVSALADRIGADGKTLPGRVFAFTDPAAFFPYSLYAAPVIHPVALVRREVFEALPFRAEFQYSSDLDFYARVAERWPMAVVPENLLHYRWYPAQSTQQFAVQIELSRSAHILATARRRAGRPEKIEQLVRFAGVSTPAEVCREMAALALADGLAAPAAYLARRALARDRSAGAAGRALLLALRAWRVAPKDKRRLVAAMFLRGPVRALGLRPVA